MERRSSTRRSRPETLCFSCIWSRCWEKLDLRYFVTRSTATTFYGEPRFTADIDVVVDLPRSRVTDLLAAFASPEDVILKQLVSCSP